MRRTVHFLITAGFICGNTLSAFAQWTRADLYPLYGDVMAYDTTRGVAVMVGGDNGNETWEWNGAGWVLASTGGPQNRHNPGLAYDSVRKVTVLFGGVTWTPGSSGTLKDDTWTWDGLKWERKAVPGPRPPARQSASMAFDTARGVMLLFSGYREPSGGLTRFYDLWEWDGTSWRELRPQGDRPQGLPYLSMAYDEGRGRLVLAGFSLHPDTGQIWEFDGSRWMKIVRPGPASVYWPLLVYDAARRKSVLGLCSYSSSSISGFVSEIWTWDGAVWEKISSSPLDFYGVTAGAYDVLRNQSLFFNGHTTMLLKGAKLSAYEPNWQYPGSPDSMAYDARSGRILMYQQLGGTWAWDGWGWYQLSQDSYPSLYSRVGTAMAFDAARGATILFGGYTSVYLGRAYINDTWRWDWKTASWNKIAEDGPPARAYHAMAYDARRAEIILFGGYGYDPESASDTFDPGTWAWDGKTWTLQASSGPSVRYGHAMAYDSDRGVVMLFGGRSALDQSTLYNDLWKWDGSSWTLVHTTGPAARSHGGLAYDSIRGKLVLYGGKGVGDVRFNDLWEYAGGVWTRIKTSPPDIRQGFKMAFNESKGKVVMAGQGDQGGRWSETWHYGPYRPVVTASSDFNGDGKSDIAVYRYPSGEWFFKDGTSFAFGTSGDVPAAGDYNGDAKAEAAVFRPLKGLWLIRGGKPIKDFGGVQDIPVPGDYNGDGRDEIAFFRPKTGRWHFYGRGVRSFGKAGDVPVPADYDGDGKIDMAVYRPSTGQWLLANGKIFKLGKFEDIPVPADYDGDGKAEPAVYRPSNGRWFILNGPQYRFGRPGDWPVPGHYDGSRKAQIAVYRLSTGEWLFRGGKTVVLGGPGRLPICR